MAVSVRLPQDTGPYIEHYLVQSTDGLLALESSRFKFDSIPALIAHYAQCCDELPVQLTLPRALREAKNRQQLSSLALLGQEFWRYPMASAGVGADGQDKQSNNSHSSSNGGSKSSSRDGNLLQPVAAQRTHVINTLVETPSEATSSLSSFTLSNLHNNRSQATTHPMDLMSPESIDSVILTMSPIDTNRSPGIIGKTSTFKVQTPSAGKSPLLPVTESYYNNYNVANNLVSPTSASNSLMMLSRNGAYPAENLLAGSANNTNNLVRATRPTPPNTLNLVPIRTPPAPPPRWSKTPTPTISPISQQNSIEASQNNFTVTTTVTFSVEGQTGSNGNGPQSLDITSPSVGDAPVSDAVNSIKLWQLVQLLLSKCLGKGYYPEQVQNPKELIKSDS